MNNKNLSEHRTFTQVRSDTLPKGEVGKGERSDARTFRRIGRNQKSAAGENGIYPARFSDSSLLGQENLSSQKNARPFQMSIQDQYKNTNIETLINALTELYDKFITQPIKEFYENIYNLDTAVNVGLDLWGERLNFPRTIKYIDEITGKESAVTLQDDEYRLILQIVTLKLYTKMSVPGINKTLKELFAFYNARAYTVDNQDMTYVNFIFLWEIPDYLKQAFSNYDLLPHPMTVGTRYREAFAQIFGFKGQNLSNNFYRSIFHKREEGGNK